MFSRSILLQYLPFKLNYSALAAQYRTKS